MYSFFIDGLSPALYRGLTVEELNRQMSEQVRQQCTRICFLYK